MKVSVAAERENITELFLTSTKHLVKYVKSFFHGFLNHCNFTETNYICLYSVFLFWFPLFFPLWKYSIVLSISIYYRLAPDYRKMCHVPQCYAQYVLNLTLAVKGL